MKQSTRTQSSKKNLIYGLCAQIITLLMGFVVRTVFIIYIGIEYLGVNGLFVNILTVLSLAELGFGTAMTHSLYKPIAQDDKAKIQALMKLYKKVYRYVAGVVLIIGLCLLPFIDIIIKNDTNIENIQPIYMLFLLNSVLSYLFVYKKSVLFADQKDYITSRIRFVFVVLKSCIQMIAMIIGGPYVIFLIIQILATIGENSYVSSLVNRLYPFIKAKNNSKLETKDLRKINADVRALVLSNIGRVALNGTDNIIISGFVGVISVGFLSNYTLITGSVIMVLSQITNSMTGSIGNYVALNNSEENMSLFNKVDFLHFWIYGFSTVALVVLLNPFITLWLGDDFILSQTTINVLCINFMINGFLNPLWVFRTTLGLFIHGKFRPIIAAVVNIVASLILVQYFGLLGVLLGTTISKVLINVWFDPYIIFKYGFNTKPNNYYVNYILRIIILVFISLTLYSFRTVFFSNELTILKFIFLMLSVSIITNGILYIFFRKSKEFIYLKNIITFRKQ